jgi:hypothetical protein
LLEGNAQPRKQMSYADCVHLSAMRGHWLDNAPFGAPLPCFMRVILSENRKYTFRDHALGRRFVGWVEQSETHRSLSLKTRGHGALRLCPPYFVAWQNSGAKKARRENGFAFHLSPVGRGRLPKEAG